jgi:hypothetical protein
MRRAAQAIQRHAALRDTAPDIGRPDDGWPALRELSIACGACG